VNKTGTNLRILIADDHEVVRSGLRSIIAGQDGWEVVAEVSDGRAAIDQTLATNPHIAILDYSLPLMNGVDVTRHIRARLPDTEVLIFTMYESDALIRELLEAGAKGYVLKSDARRSLITAVEALAAHRPFFTGKVSEALLGAFLSGNKAQETALTSREREVVQLVAEGHSNKATANLLNISLKTVETHRASAMRKLNVNSAAELVRYAVRNNLAAL
jgi:DNA-binding NarL/FixJ family response regulator